MIALLFRSSKSGFSKWGQETQSVDSPRRSTTFGDLGTVNEDEQSVVAVSLDAGDDSERKLCRTTSSRKGEDNESLQERDEKKKSIFHNCWRTLLIVCFYSCGTLFFTLGPEKWSFVRSVYFLSVTITTVGFGDVTPDQTSTRLTTILIILIGLIVIFPTLADIAVHFIVIMEKSLERISRKANLSSHTAKILFSLFLILAPLGISVVYFHMRQVESGRWDFTEALWWSIATITTLGYGDLSFTHETETQIFLAIFIPFSTVSAGAAIANLANARLDWLNEIKERHLLETFDVETILKFDSSGDGEVDKAEYILGMLQSMDLVDPEKVKLYEAQFERHDADGSGTLTREDLDQIAMEMRASTTLSSRSNTASRNTSPETSPDTSPSFDQP